MRLPAPMLKRNGAGHNHALAWPISCSINIEARKPGETAMDINYKCSRRSSSPFKAGPSNRISAASKTRLTATQTAAG